MTRSVRLAAASDLDDVLALLHGAADWLHSRGIDQWPDGSPTLSAHAIGGHIAAGHTWLASEDDRPVATIAMDAEADPDFWSAAEARAPAWYISKLATARTAPKGTGALLLRWAVDRAWREGMELVRLDVWRTNRALQDWYRQQGWAHLRTVIAPGRRSGALFERMAFPDWEARESWEPELIPDGRPQYLSRMLRSPLPEGARVRAASGTGTVAAVLAASYGQEVAGRVSDYPQAVYDVRLDDGSLVACRDIDLERL